MTTLFKRLSILICFLLSTFLLLACKSNDLPEGSSAPQLQINNLALTTVNDMPCFVIDYTLEHHSASPLPLLSINADVFLKDVKVATYFEQLQNEFVPANDKIQYQLIMPVNESNAAAYDSLAKNPHLVIEGSCALTLSFTLEEQQKSFNPSASYHNFVKVIKQ